LDKETRDGEVKVWDRVITGVRDREEGSKMAWDKGRWWGEWKGEVGLARTRARRGDDTARGPGRKERARGKYARRGGSVVWDL
jgi:hypothetical protein